MFLESPGINSPNRSRLDGIQTKIVRAYEHCSTLDNAIKSFIDSENHVVTHQFDPETFEHIWRLESAPPPIHSIIYALIGDALHNFRDALDHIVWQLSWLTGRPPAGVMHFRFTSTKFNTRIGVKGSFKGSTQMRKPSFPKRNLATEGTRFCGLSKNSLQKV